MSILIHESDLFEFFYHRKSIDDEPGSHHKRNCCQHVGNSSGIGRMSHFKHTIVSGNQNRNSNEKEMELFKRNHERLAWSIKVIMGMNMQNRKKINVRAKSQIIVCFSVMRCMKYPATRLAFTVAIVKAKKMASIVDTFR